MTCKQSRTSSHKPGMRKPQTSPIFLSTGLFNQSKDCQMSYLLITDDDIARYLSMPQALICMEESFRLHAADRLIAPARSDTDLNEAGKFVFTVGGSTGTDSLVGFRVYDMNHFKSSHRDELVAVFCGSTGAIKALVAGTQLGPIRTGAIGGVAIKYLSRSNSKVLGLIGTGPQGRTQLLAAASVRQFDKIKVFSRNPRRCGEFAGQMSRELGQPVQAAMSAREAVEEADVLICATVSPDPVRPIGSSLECTSTTSARSLKTTGNSTSVSPSGRHCWSRTQWPRSTNTATSLSPRQVLYINVCKSWHRSSQEPLYKNGPVNKSHCSTHSDWQGPK